jgi:hypothetical protein
VHDESQCDRPTEEKSSGETMRLDAWRRRGRADTAGPRVVMACGKVEVDLVRPSDE